MRTQAAVMYGFDEPLRVEEIEVEPPGAGEVGLRMVAAGICGSDLHVRQGDLPVAMPAVAGHEGSAVVEAVGPGVTGYAIGDHVIQTFVATCGNCEACRRGQTSFCANGMTFDGRYADGGYRMHTTAGDPIGAPLRLGTFAAHTVTPITNLIKVSPDVDLVTAALVSCGVSTGLGAAINIARVTPGDTVAVVGIGGVGAAALLGSALAGAGKILAVDIADHKSATALGFGATEFVNARESDLVTAALAATNGRGVDKVLLTTDVIRGPLVAAAVNALAPEGIAVVVGITEKGLDSIPLSPSALVGRQRTLTGTTYGGANPQRDARRWLDLYRAGRLPLDDLITRRYRLDEINQAFDDLVAGVNVRGVVVYE